MFPLEEAEIRDMVEELIHELGVAFGPGVVTLSEELGTSRFTCRIDMGAWRGLRSVGARRPREKQS